MKKELILSYFFLLLLTISSAVVANSFLVSLVMVGLLMILAGIKFMVVAFQFMELKHAHNFWKIGLTLTLGLLVFLIIALK